jgi:hypothetical protein
MLMTAIAAYACVVLALGGTSPPAPTVETMVSTQDTAVRIRAGDAALRVISIGHPQAGSGWTAESVERTSIALIPSIEVGGRTVPVHWCFRGQLNEPGRSETIFRFTCDEPALELKSVWRAYPGPGPVEHQILISNQGKETVLLPLQPTLAFSVQNPLGHTLEHWWVERGGSIPSNVGTHQERIVPGSRTSLVSTPNGTSLMSTPDGRSVAPPPNGEPSPWEKAHGPIPWFSVHDREGRRGWYAGIEFSGFVRMDLQADAGETGRGVRALTAVLGLGKSDSEDASYRTRVFPGETFETPTVFVGCYAGDVDDGANRLRRWVEAHICPSSHANLPLLVNNTWGDPPKFAINEAFARRMIDSSAALGMEMYHVDAGWFRYVGDWRCDPTKFPAGLTPIVDYARSKGMSFGLWIAWVTGGDRADNTGQHAVLSVRDPTMRSWFSNDYPETWKSGAYTGVSVCLGEPKAVEWCLGDMRRAVGEFRMDLLEHDNMQIVERCGRQDHRHTSSPIDVAYRATLGYYRVQDGLRASFPDLLFEDCNGGGHTVDYGVLRRSHYISITDHFDPLSNRRAFYDASYALPPTVCECYVENRPGKTLASFRYMLRSGMMGWCSIMIDTSRWSPEQQAAAKRQIKIYKSKLRPLIQRANLYHVSERPDGQRWDGMQYYDPSAGEGVLFAFRGTTSDNKRRFQLKGLDPDARYRVVCEDSSSPPTVIVGRELLQAGVSVTLLEPESSELVYLKRQ